MNEYSYVTYASGSMIVENDDGELVHVDFDDVDESSEYWDFVESRRKAGEKLGKAMMRKWQSDGLHLQPWSPKPVRTLLSLAIERVTNE